MKNLFKRIIRAYFVYYLGKKYIIPNQEKLAKYFQKQLASSSQKSDDWGTIIKKDEKGE